MINTIYESAIRKNIITEINPLEEAYFFMISQENLIQSFMESMYNSSIISIQENAYITEAAEFFEKN